MGLLDRFRKNKQEEIVKEEMVQTKQYVPPFGVEFKMINDGLIQVDFYDGNAEFNQFYDTTRLIANPQPIKAYGNDNVLNCKVSWYGENDVQMIGDDAKEIGRRVQYRGVLAQIDLNLLQTDREYCYTVMKGLLNKKRVEQYLDRGLQENPEKPCGKYIGAVMQKENGDGYCKVFDERIGRQSHYSDLMVNRRIEHRKQQEMLRQKQIDDRRKQIEKLQGEIDSLEER